MIGRTLANYRVVSQLGAGGMGVVYKALDVRLDRSVALKVLPPGKSADADRRARFLQEARSASALNDPHIVTIHDIFVTEDGTDVLVMELIPGRTLRDVIADRPIPEGEALRLMLQVADGVAAAHAAGIVHRDLKPGNIMVTDRGRVKILDFGLAKLTGPADEQPTMMAPNTVEGTLLGTVDYMSPEQARGEAVDHRSDIFSLGAVLYELLTGAKPFQASHTIGVLHEILYGQIVPPRDRRPEISGDAEAITLRALERDVNRRYQSMDAMASDLRAAQRALGDGISSASRSGIAPAVPPAIPASASSPGAPPPSTAPEAAAAFARKAIASAAGAAVLGTVLFAFPATRVWILEQLARSGGSRVTGPVTARSTTETPYEMTQRGLALLKRFDQPGNIDAAIELLDQTVAADPKFAPAYAALAQAYVRQSDDKRDPTWASRAVDTARQAVALDEFLADGHLSLGMSLIAATDTKAAEVPLRRTLALDPQNARAWFALGELAWKERRRGDAAEAYRKAYDLAPEEWETARALGNVAYFNGQYDEAARWYTRAVDLAPDVAIAHYTLASALAMKGEPAAAAASLQKSISIRPSPSAYSNLGTTLFLQGRYRESVDAFKKGVELRPADPLMWGNLGDAYRSTAGGQNDANESYLRAIQLLSEQLRRSPSDHQSRSRLALYRAKRGDTREALADLGAIAELGNQDVNTLYRVAVVHELAGNRSESLRWLGRALSAGYSMRDVSTDPELSRLRSDVEYQRLAARFDKRDAD